MRIGVVGAGITGLTVAHGLQTSGHDVTVFESHTEIGGLASSVSIGGGLLERYYHHFFMNDTDLLTLLAELDLSRYVVWSESRIGYYHGDRIYKFSNPLDLLTFHPLNTTGKIQFALTTLYFQMKRSSYSLDTMSVSDWFHRYGAAQVYDQVWKPLLMKKFGEHHENISVAWLWGRVHPRSRSRSRRLGNERLGYLKGSLSRLFQALSARFVDAGGRTLIACPVQSVQPLPNGRILVRTPRDEFTFDKVVSTAPVPVFLETVGGLPTTYRDRLQAISYRAVMCMIMSMASPLMKDVYWLNISNETIPFGGIVEHTNLIPSSSYGGRHIVYVFAYISPYDPLFLADDDFVRQLYFQGLARMFPAFDGSSVQDAVVSRSAFASPVYRLNYLSRLPDYLTPVPNLLLANTTQVYPQDRNMNNCIANAQAVCRWLKSEKMQRKWVP